MKREIIPRHWERSASAGCLSHLNVSGITTLRRCVHFTLTIWMSHELHFRLAFAGENWDTATQHRSADRLTRVPNSW